MRAPRQDRTLLALALLLGLGPSCGDEAEGIVELEISGTLDDLDAGGLGGGDGPTMRETLHLLRVASEDEEVSGVLVRIGPLGAGPARIEEVGAGLRRLRDEGRTVHCHLQSASNFSYLLAASGCERIALSPGGSVDLTGLAAESIYIRDLLESVGLEADVMTMGSHKGAAEFLTHAEMSPETRETLEALLDDLTALLVEGIAEGRDLDEAATRDLVGGGPYTAEQALEAGLVDALEYGDEARGALEAALPGEPELLEDWAEDNAPGGARGLLQVLAGGSPRGPTRGPRVAVLYLAGPIVGEEGGSSLLGPQISLDRVRRTLEEIQEDDEIRALVLRVDSPGGSALASDEIWHDILEIRADRPVVASMGDVAASGGYYLAAAATEVLAGRGTLTGSIGVVGGKLVAEDLMERAGANPVILRRGRNAGLESAARPFTAGQREALRRQMEAVYERFIEAVVRGRVMDEDQVRRLATGRVWSGTRALELGLVDRIGGLHDAIALARELAGLPEDAPVQAFPRRVGLLEQLEEGDALPAVLAAGLLPDRRAIRPLRHLEPGLTAALLLDREPVLALWPAWTTVR